MDDDVKLLDGVLSCGLASAFTNELREQREAWERVKLRLLTPQRRVPVQIAIAPQTDSSNWETHLALASDGTMWRRIEPKMPKTDCGDWVRLPDLPQDPKEG